MGGVSLQRAVGMMATAAVLAAASPLQAVASAVPKLATRSISSSSAQAPAALRLAARTKLDTLTSSPNPWTQDAELTPSNGAKWHDFGWSVAISGSTAVMGARAPFYVGAAYVFVGAGPTWSQQAQLLASDGAVGDNFGWSVAIDGSTVVVGAYGKSSSKGEAYVFVRTGSSWSQQAKLIASDGAPNDQFGWSVAVSGSTVIVGAPKTNTGTAGVAYVFTRSGTAWSQKAKLIASDVNGSLGFSVAIDGSTMVSGGLAAAYVFVDSGTSWSQQAKLTPADSAINFGSSIAISGTSVVVGAPSQAQGPGAAYVFVASGTAWSQQAKLIASDAGTVTDAFGDSVAISGSTVVSGDWLQSNHGAAYVFVGTNGTWSQEQKLTASNAATEDYFGRSVAVYGATAVVGAYGDDTRVGSTYIYNRPCSGAGLSASPGSPQPSGGVVQFTATSSGCTAPLYEFWLQYPNGAWVMKQAFGTSATWNWSTAGYPAGTYTIHAWANESGTGTAAWQAYGSAAYTLTIPAQCATASLSPTNPTGPAGSAVPLTASSTGCPNPMYEFWVQFPGGVWHLIQGWGGSAFNWNTTNLAPGTYVVHVWANQNGDQVAMWEAYGSDNVTLTGCATAALSPTNQNAPAGATVGLTAGSTGCANPQYEYWAQYPNGTWHLARSWGAPAFNWNTAGLGPGNYTIHVWANNIGDPTATWEAYGAGTVTLTGCTSATVSIYFVVEVRFAATSSGCTATPVYEFWLQDPKGNWTMLQAFSTNQYATWGGYTGAPPGVYHIHVWANNQGADTSTYEALGVMTYTHP